jgi:ATP-dependent protease ClpP protease subunit
MLKSSLLPLVVVACLLDAPIQSARSEPARIDGSVDCTKLTGSCFVAGARLRGEIDASAVDKIRTMVADVRKSADREKKQVHPFSIELNSPGGSVTAAIALGKLLRREGLGVTIAGAFPPFPPGSCNSACVLVFAGAVHRSFNQSTSRLGIHRPYLDVPQQEVSPERVREIYRQVLRDVRTYLQEMNVSEQLAEAMFRIEPEKLRFLTESNAAAYGLTEWDPVYKEIRDVQEAKMLALDRQEFMRRRALALEDCGWLVPDRYAAMDNWFQCYDGVMTHTRPAPLPPPSPLGGIDFAQFGGTPADPIDWARVPLR